MIEAPFLVVTLVLFGTGALLTGQVLASRWRPLWQIVPASLGLGLGDRFLLYALFGEALTSLARFVVAASIMLLYAFIAYRVTLARQMVRQYPWLYRAAGPFGWRDKN
ncbi:MAG TPA: hypothetical protein VKT70_00130 [Stellaceae bacterium]|nr:hypothetical protein [Stellaceae bacterium]